jgi:hypothetical protein
MNHYLSLYVRTSKTPTSSNSFKYLTAILKENNLHNWMIIFFWITFSQNYGIQQQWSPLNVITLCRTMTANTNWMLTKSEKLYYLCKVVYLVIWDLVNLVRFDRMNQMKTLTMITLNSDNCKKPILPMKMTISKELEVPYPIPISQQFSTWGTRAVTRVLKAISF